jgi:addiction module HigA family antidote
MRKKSPTHPGAILREDVFPTLGISVTEFARHLGVSRQTLHAVLSEKSGVTPELALRLGAFLGNGPQLWIGMQSKYDLWHAKLKLKKVLPKIPLFKDLVAA